ncbi:MAG TPA: 4'-phosphopantetheinyl transferase superfamily protein [Polyangia bacterium]
MFRYKLVHASAFPSLAHGQAWPCFLSPREERILAALGIVPRRRKWLMGRAAAKQLVRDMSPGEEVPDHRISVLNQPSGEPFVLIEGRGGWGRAISLSHRSDVGMAAAPLDQTSRIGADVETVEPRDPALVRQFYTDGEAEIVEAAGDDRDEVVARIWSAKEAVLKLLGLGLRIDTRGVVVDLAGHAFPECPAEWQPVDVNVIAELPRQSMLDNLRVMWRRQSGYVLTVAVAG